MKKTIVLLVPALFLAMIGVVLSPTPSQAQVLTIRDGHDPGRYVDDIRAIKVTHGPKNLFVRIKFFPRVRAARVNVAVAWIDTRKGNRGPEFALRRHDGWPRSLVVTRVDNWRWGGEKDRTCRRARVTVDSGDLLMKVPRGCLRIKDKKPAKARVAVNTYDEQFVRQTQDWAPRARHFGKGRWVRST